MLSNRTADSQVCQEQLSPPIKAAVTAERANLIDRLAGAVHEVNARRVEKGDILALRVPRGHRAVSPNVREPFELTARHIHAPQVPRQAVRPRALEQAGERES